MFVHRRHIIDAENAVSFAISYISQPEELLEKCFLDEGGGTVVGGSLMVVGLREPPDTPV